MVEGTKITFGKHKGLTWEHLVNANPSYVIWAARNVKQNNCPIQVLRAAIKVYNKRTQVNPYWGTCPTWNYDHPDYIGY